jgi:DNA-binding MarR family transcriptional regulator
MAHSISTLFNSIQYVRDTLKDDIPIQQLALFLLIGMEEGSPTPVLMKKLKMTQGAISRNIKALSQFMDDDTLRGLDLIYCKPDVTERRRLSVFLTPKGKDVFFKLDDLMKCA